MNDDCRCAQSYYNNKPKVRLESQTTNKAAYKEYAIQPGPTITAPKVVQKHYDPDVLQSNYKSTFTKPPPKPADQSGNLVSQYYQSKPKTLPLSSETEYNKTYKKHEVKVAPQPIYEYKPKHTKFEGESSYKASFVPKKNTDFDSGNKSGNAVKDYMANRPQVKFEGSSSYQDTFKGYEVRPQAQPTYEYKPKQSKFQGQSSYKSSFKQFGREAYGKSSEYCPIHPDKLAIK